MEKERERITFCIPPDWKEKFIQYARDKGSNPSQLLRDFIRETISK